MGDESTPHPVTFWVDETRVDLVRDIAEALGDRVTITSIGGPRSAAMDRLSRDLGVRHMDDPRLWSADSHSTSALIATMESLGAAELATSRRRGCQIVTLDPVYATLDDLRQHDEPLHVPLLPAMMRSDEWSAAAELPAESGPVRSVVYTSCARRGVASLFAQLFEAWRVVLALGELPVSIDASLVGSLGASSEGARLACGDLSAHARMPDDRSAVVHVSDRFGAGDRQVTLLARDRKQTLTESHDNGAAPSFAARIAHQWLDIITHPTQPAVPAIEPPDEAVACCLAALLSARTGEPESPRKLLELSR